MNKQILFGLIIGMMVATPVWGAKNKVVKIGERPESVTKGFGGKYYVTVMNSPDKEGDAVIKVLDGEMAKVLLRSGKVRESRWSPRCGLRSPAMSRGPHAPGPT